MQPIYNRYMKIQICDRMTYAISKREYTDEGFLRVPGLVARTGIQEYLASELGLPGDPVRIVKVMRPADEVFHVDSLASYALSDVTVEHPSEMVDSSTFKTVSVGVVSGPGIIDGDFVQSDLIIKDKDAITAVEDGKVELSAGYTALYDDAVPEGADYEFIQRDIRINHVALVDRARAGAQARLFDHKPEITIMTFKVTLDSGRTVEIADEAVATLVNDTIDRLQTESTDSKGLVEKLTASNDLLKEQLDSANKLSTPEAIAARVAAVSKTLDMAVKIAGKEFSCDSTDLVDIQRAALASKRPSLDWAKKSDIYVQAAFDQGFESAEEEETKDGDDEGEKNSNDSHRQLSKDAALKPVVHGSARVKNNDSMTQSWKKTAGVA